MGSGSETGEISGGNLPFIKSFMALLSIGMAMRVSDLLPSRGRREGSWSSGSR